MRTRAGWDEQLDSILMSFDPAGPAGVVHAPLVAGIDVALDLSDAGRIVKLVVPRHRDGELPLRYLAGLLPASVSLLEADRDAFSNGEPQQLDVGEVPTPARDLLRRLAVAALNRGDEEAWDVEFTWLHSELSRVCGWSTEEPPSELLPRWLQSFADAGCLYETNIELVLGDAGDDPSLALGLQQRSARHAIGLARSGQSTADEAPVPLLLTEQRGRTQPSSWQLAGSELVGDPEGPAGSFEFSLGGLTVECDLLEPTRVIRTRGLDLPFDDPERVAYEFISSVQPLLVLARDRELLAGEVGVEFEHALASAELAVALAESNWTGASELVATVGAQAIDELLRAWDGDLEALPEDQRRILDRLGEAVDTSALWSRVLPRFRSGFGSAMGSPSSEAGSGAVAERPLDIDLEALLDGLGGSRIDPDLGSVALSAEARSVLDPTGVGVTVTVVTTPGPVAHLHLEVPGSQGGRIRVRLFRDLEMLGEAVLELTPVVDMRIPVAGIADRLDVESVTAGDRGLAVSAGRRALSAELTKSPDAVSLWLAAGDAWADLGEANMAAIAIERAALLAPPRIGWQLIRRALILGTDWANGRIRPPETFLPVWRGGDRN